jgi:hypothetical protein
LIVVVDTSVDNIGSNWKGGGFKDLFASIGDDVNKELEDSLDAWNIYIKKN